MKRYIAQFHSAGFPERYVVVDTTKDAGGIISEPMAYHLANDEARRLNKEPEPYAEPVNIYSGWAGAFSATP